MTVSLQDTLEQPSSSTTLQSGFVETMKSQFLANPSKHWNLFYKRNSNHFFKDRHWTDREFSELLPPSSSSSSQDHRKLLLEIGCGHGSFVFPLLKSNPSLQIFACDFSSHAIELVKASPDYDPSRLTAFVCDISQKEALVPQLPSPAMMDLVSCIFVLSALRPETLEPAFSNIYSVLKPGGLLLFRDYAVGDLTQLRFKPESKIQENLHYRQDGTLSYFFSKDFLLELTEKIGFETVECELVHRKVVNRKKDLEMDRIFIQCKFRKPNTPL